MAIDMNHKATKQMNEVLGTSPRPAEKKVQLCLYVTESQRAKVKMAAARRHTTMSGLLLDYVNQVIAEEEREGA